MLNIIKSRFFLFLNFLQHQNQNTQMSSYIIAGSADNIDTAYCQEIARRIKSKYKNIDFRVVIKHPTEWEEYLQQICRIYGFLRKSNPIIYTFDGKIIGNKEAFMSATAKYFGLDEQSLNVQNLSNEVNMKIATQQIRQKNFKRNNIQTLHQKIQNKYQELLKKNILKHQLKQKKQYLTNGIYYIHRSVKGLVPYISFVKNKQVKVQIEDVVVADIDLMALSFNDQIKIQQQPGVAPIVPAGKEAFVTANQKNNSEHDKMSEASRTNKMHESIISYDKQSKNMKESSKSKLRIDQQNDEIPDYVDYQMTDTVFAQLSDDFFVGFLKESSITGEMIFYHNQDQNGNSLRVYNDNRPVKGHRVLIKQIHFDGQNTLLQKNPSQIMKGTQLFQQNTRNQASQEILVSNPVNESQKTLKQEKPNQSSHQQNDLLQPKAQIQKIKTEPNLPHLNSMANKNLIIDDDSFSQANSDLNLISHLNFHTLFVQKPLSSIEIKNLIYFIKQTNCIGCLQFLGENPNPCLKVYHRKLLLQTKHQKQQGLLLPVEKFIQKQIEDQQFSRISVPNQRCYDYESVQGDPKFQLLQINDIGYEHYIYLLQEEVKSDEIFKALKYTIDSMFYLEEQLKKEIGYNLVFTKKFILLVPLTQPYLNYNSAKLNYDGLAYLGFVHTADVLRPYELNKRLSSNIGDRIRKSLKHCSNPSAKYQF